MSKEVICFMQTGHACAARREAAIPCPLLTIMTLFDCMVSMTLYSHHNAAVAIETAATTNGRHRITCGKRCSHLRSHNTTASKSRHTALMAMVCLCWLEAMDLPLTVGF